MLINLVTLLWVFVHVVAFVATMKNGVDFDGNVMFVELVVTANYRFVVNSLMMDEYLLIVPIYLSGLIDYYSCYLVLTIMGISIKQDLNLEENILRNTYH